MAGKTDKVILGIDLGGTGIKIGVLDTSYTILAQTTIPTNAKRPYQKVIEDMGNTAVSLLTSHGFRLQDCIGAGVGSPGTIDSRSGTVLYSNNMQWDHVPLAKELHQYVRVPVFVNNDANCAALGEVVKGAAKGCQNAVFLTLGTGVGGGIILDGKIFEGAHAGGVELGHIKSGSLGRRCTCGRMDCLEAYASATALIADAKEMAARHPDSLLWELCGRSLDQMDAKMPFDAAWAGDACGQTLVKRYIGYLADGLTDLANIFRPDILVLGGGISAQGEKLTGPLHQFLQENCFGTQVSYVPRVVIAQNGNNAGMIGAASLVAADSANRSVSAQGADPVQLLFLDPVCTENIWGGSRLRDEFHYAKAGAHTGECWGISAHPNGDGTIRNGALAGKKLSAVWKQYPQLFANPAGDRFPLLVKMIDAKDDLSIQVHPNDAYAAQEEQGSFGKTECWYVLDCPASAALVIGHHAETKKELEEWIEAGNWEQLIREVPIRKGDFIQIDPGTVHAIKGGCLILETQQSSDITYRLYDYGRLDNGRRRPLHLRQSMDVITVPAASPDACIRHTGNIPQNQLEEIYRCGYYRIFRLDAAGSYTLKQEYPYMLLSVLEGSGMADTVPIQKGDHFIIPHGYGSLHLTGDVKLIASVAET